MFAVESIINFSISINSKISIWSSVNFNMVAGYSNFSLSLNNSIFFDLYKQHSFNMAAVESSPNFLIALNSILSICHRGILVFRSL